MRKIFMLTTMLAMFVGSLLSSCGTSKKEAQVAEEQDSVEISVPTKVSSNHGKVLVAYFTVPETDGVDAIKTIRGLEKDATVLDGYAVERDRVPESEELVNKWLKRIGMAK